MAGAGTEAQLQLTGAAGSGRRGLVLLLLGMTGWIVAGFLGAVLAAVVLAAASGFLSARFGSTALPAPGQAIFVLVGAGVFQSILLFAAFRQTRAAGRDRRAALGLRPVQRRGTVALLCAGLLLWAACLLVLMEAFPSWRAFVRSVMPHPDGSDTVAVLVLNAMLVAVLAPLSEELFFRGWLWEAFRGRGYAVAITACLTAIPWLLLHALDSPARVLLLLPAAVIFSLARHVGDSVLASLSVHVVNNLAAVAMQILSKL